jgi:hypothetical protein
MAEHRSRTSERILNALRAVFPAWAELTLASAPTEAHVADVKVSGRRFRAQWLPSGIPSEVRALAALKVQPEVVVARRMSPGAQEALAELRIGWVDELGAAEIMLGPIIISRTARRPSPPSKAKEQWTPAVLSVAEALLCGVQPTVSATHQATGLSGGSCGNALRLFTARGLLVADANRGPASGRRIQNKRSLLEAYASEAAASPAPPTLVVGVTWRDPVRGLVELGRRWGDQEIAWAASGPTAAAVMAPLLTTVSSARVYVDAASVAGLEALASRSDLRPIEGGRLTLASFPTTSTRSLARTVENMRVAPWPRVYVDLLAAGVRGEEAAEHLWEVIDGRRT